MQSEVAGELRRRIPRLIGLSRQVFGARALAVAGVRLHLRFDSEWIIGLVGTPDHAVIRVILDSAGSELLHIFARLIVNRVRFAIIRRGDAHTQRLGTRATTRLQCSHQIRRLMHMKLIDDEAVKIHAMRRIGGTGNHFHVTAGAIVDDTLLMRRHHTLQSRRLLHKLFDRLEDEASLMFGGRGAHDLRPRLTIGTKHIDRDATRQRRLSVLTRHIDIQIADDAHPLSVGVLLHPSEHWGEDPHQLPRVRVKRLASPLALRVTECVEAQ